MAARVVITEALRLDLNHILTNCHRLAIERELKANPPTGKRKKRKEKRAAKKAAEDGEIRLKKVRIKVNWLPVL